MTPCCIANIKPSDMEHDIWHTCMHTIPSYVYMCWQYIFFVLFFFISLRSFSHSTPTQIPNSSYRVYTHVLYSPPHLPTYRVCIPVYPRSCFVHSLYTSDGVSVSEKYIIDMWSYVDTSPNVYAYLQLYAWWVLGMHGIPTGHVSGEVCMARMPGSS